MPARAELLPFRDVFGPPLGWPFACLVVAGSASSSRGAIPTRKGGLRAWRAASSRSKLKIAGNPPVGVIGAARPKARAQPSMRTAAAGRCTGGWQVAHRQPRDPLRSVHQRAPWQARHQAPGGGGVGSDQLGG
jgi:hypothetical protein